MQKAKLACAIAATAMLLQGCSSRPRNFSANIAAPVPDRTAFEQDYRTCQSLVKGGRKSDFKAGAATALASGAGAFGAGTAMASTGMIGIGMSGSSAAAAATAIPVVGFFAGFGVSRAIRGGKERKFKRAMSDCLGEYGYSVEGWTKLHKRDDAAKAASQSATIIASAEPASLTD